MLFLFLILALVRITQSFSCLNCICDLESGCQAKECQLKGDSEACGYYQINQDYFVDCGHPGLEANESVEEAWKRCSMDKECSRECVKGYYNRYKHKCTEFDECEAMARLHSGGPDGCVKSITWDYWKKIQKCCGCQ